MTTRLPTCRRSAELRLNVDVAACARVATTLCLRNDHIVNDLKKICVYLCTSMWVYLLSSSGSVLVPWLCAHSSIKLPMYVTYGRCCYRSSSIVFNAQVQRLQLVLLHRRGCPCARRWCTCMHRSNVHTGEQALRLRGLGKRDHITNGRRAWAYSKYEVCSFASVALHVPASSMTRRSTPRAMPPCGGAPSWKLSSR